MQLPIKLVDPTLPLPNYQTTGSVAFDLYARTDCTIQPQELYRIPTNVIAKIPTGYFLFVVPRSSTPKKFGLLYPHGGGIVDTDYCGPNDEIMLQVVNYRSEPVTITRGERIGQALLLPVERAEIVLQTADFAETSRGGFGSTGH